MTRNNTEFRGAVSTPLSKVEQFVPSDFHDGDWSDPIRMSSVDRETCENHHAHGEGYLDDLKSQIATNGIKNPVEATKLDNGHTLLTEGHHRVMAARELGINTVPVVFK
jgi:hypothetical protein